MTTSASGRGGIERKGKKQSKERNDEAIDLAVTLFQTSRSNSNSEPTVMTYNTRGVMPSEQSTVSTVPQLSTTPVIPNRDGLSIGYDHTNNNVDVFSIVSQASPAPGRPSIDSHSATVPEGYLYFANDIENDNEVSCASYHDHNESSTTLSLASQGQHARAQLEIDYVVESLLSHNPDVSHEAALEAAFVAQGDINVSQFLIEKAISAPPVCRHMLSDGCYRSDCHFSHDIRGHTCTFWLRGRCAKGLDCKFLHGFNSSLLEGMRGTGQGETAIRKSGESRHLIESVDQLSINGGAQYHERSYPMLQPKPPQQALLSSSGNSWQSGLALSRSGSPWVSNEQSKASFANVAKASGSPSCGTKESLQYSTKKANTTKYVKIPQKLWNPSDNRNSEVFHIADPIERFYAVNSGVSLQRGVMDLHFQSMKTAPLVLASILPTQLEQGRTDESSGVKGVWIVTGSGHHVNSRSHQKSGGVLENTVLSWLDNNGFNYFLGKDRNGHSGAILVTGQRERGR